MCLAYFLCCKVDMFDGFFDVKWTSLFEWCMGGCESKNMHQKDMC